MKSSPHGHGGSRRLAESLSASPRRSPRLRGSAGFTLLEVMLAVAIIATALLSLQTIVSGGLLAALTTVNRRAAREVCRERLEAIVADEAGASNDRGEDPVHGFKWSAAREERTVGAADTPIEKVVVVTVKVEYPVERPEPGGGSAEQMQTYELSTIVAAPKPQTP